MKRLSGVFFLFLITIQLSAQSDFRIIFYNVENFFDTKDNPLKDDDAFLPTGTQRWTEIRYQVKLFGIANVIDSLTKKNTPAIIGLCEVENAAVLEDLCTLTPLRKHHFKYLVTDSKDNRGINVALLYKPEKFRLISSKEYTPVFEEDNHKHTRDILHATGILPNKDTLDVFVCHFPSRNEGIKRTQPYRIETAKLLKVKTDSLLMHRNTPHLIIMGDFNDYPDDISLRHILEAQSKNREKKAAELYNMFLHQANDKKTGTYKYRGRWRIMDQFIVNGNLLKVHNKTQINNFSAHIYKAPFLMEKDDKYGGQKPFRMYSGYKYLGGTSDHLPIYMDLILKD